MKAEGKKWDEEEEKDLSLYTHRQQHTTWYLDLLVHPFEELNICKQGSMSTRHTSSRLVLTRSMETDLLLSRREPRTPSHNNEIGDRAFHRGQLQNETWVERVESFMLCCHWNCRASTRKSRNRFWANYPRRSQEKITQAGLPIATATTSPTPAPPPHTQSFSFFSRTPLVFRRHPWSLPQGDGVCREKRVARQISP